MFIIFLLHCFLWSLFFKIFFSIAEVAVLNKGEKTSLNDCFFLLQKKKKKMLIRFEAEIFSIVFNGNSNIKKIAFRKKIKTFVFLAVNHA